MLSTDPKFEQLILEAIEAGFLGWNFPFRKDRWITTQPSWDYREIVNERMKNAQTLLDMGTGGGELLSTLPLPKTTFATEGYVPNVPIARERLGKLGVKVIDNYTDDDLPFEDVLRSRHQPPRILFAAGSFPHPETGRGFITQ